MDTQQSSIFTAVLITCIIITVVLTYFIVTIIRAHRRNVTLYKAKILAEVTTLENERARIANDLHDELGPILSSAKLRINSLEIHADEDIQQLQKINVNIDDIIQRMRFIANNLLPNTLQRKGLVSAINELISNIGEAGGIEIKFVHRDIPELPRNVAINLFRILSEIIHNCVKHAEARELRIQMGVTGSTLRILCADNGIGFDYELLMRENTGLGLRNLLNRTEILGGEMFVDSKKGKGTQYIFEIPLQ